MKASHFKIGKTDGDMVNPKPVPPIDSSFTIKDFDIEHAKKRLSQASWTTGQSPMLYETINGSTYMPSDKAGRATAMQEAKEKIHALKARTFSSSVMQNAASEPLSDQLY